MTSSLMKLWRRLLMTPLYWKLLIANGAIVLLAVLATSLAAHLKPASSLLGVAGPVSVGAVIISVIVNALVVKLALDPLERLTDAVRRAEGGDYAARAELSPVADRNLVQLVSTFNAMLDSVAEYRRRLRALTVRDLNQHEAQRSQLSHDLHDGTAQSLAALLFQLKVARTTTDAAERDALLADVSSQLVDAIEDLRAIAQDLRPQTLDMLGISPALETYARSLSERTGFPVAVSVAPLDGLLEPDTELSLYRLVQEALLNVVQHANATSASVTVEHDGARVLALIRDNGRGFDADAAFRNGATTGLFGMRERAAHAGGTLGVRSGEGKGTEIRLEFPLRNTKVRYA
jgi:signal transduction histidine kinase